MREQFTKFVTAIYCHQVEWDADFRGDRLKTSVHAFASPFKAPAERANWLGMPVKSDDFGRAVLATGVPRTTIKAWCDDLDVSYQGKAQSWFDLVEERDGVVCMMRAFGSGGRFGPIITLSHRCPPIA